MVLKGPGHHPRPRPPFSGRVVLTRLRWKEGRMAASGKDLLSGHRGLTGAGCCPLSCFPALVRTPCLELDSLSPQLGWDEPTEDGRAETQAHPGRADRAELSGQPCGRVLWPSHQKTTHAGRFKTLLTPLSGLADPSTVSDGTLSPPPRSLRASDGGRGLGGNRAALPTRAVPGCRLEHSFLLTEEKNSVPFMLCLCSV